MYPSKFKIKKKHKVYVFVPFLENLIEWDTDGNLTTKLNDKRDDVIFTIVIFFTYVAIHFHVEFLSFSQLDTQGLTLRMNSYKDKARY